MRRHWGLVDRWNQVAAGLDVKTAKFNRTKAGYESIPSTGLADRKERPYRGQKLTATHWASQRDLLDFVAAATTGNKATSHESGSDDHEWTWGFTTAETLALGARGWTDGYAEVGTKAVTMANEYLATQETPATVMDVSGAVPDVAAYLNGEPECMINFNTEPREVRSVRLAVSGFISGGEPASLLFARGISIMSAILSLEAQGIAVNVDMILNAQESGGGRTGTWSVTLHRAGDVLDPASLMFALAHPAFYRLVMIGAADLVLGNPTGSFANRRLPPATPGTVNVEGVMFGQQPWGTKEANDKLMQDCLNNAQ